VIKAGNLEFERVLFFSDAVRRIAALRMLVAPLVFLVSIPIALVVAGQAEYVWIMVWVLNLPINVIARREEDGALAGWSTRMMHRPG